MHTRYFRLYGKWGLLTLIPLLFTLIFTLKWDQVFALATAPQGYRQIALVPDTLQCFDIGYLAQDDYYLANSTEKRIDHIDLDENRRRQLHVEPLHASGFSGNGGCLSHNYSQMGPAGVLMDAQQQLWAANGDSSLVIFSSDHHRVARVSTGGAKRTDEMALDARRGVLVVANPDEHIPFLTFIDTHSHKIISKLFFPQATAGLEQSVWIQGVTTRNDRFYLSVPATASHPNGEIAVIDAASRTLIGSYPLPVLCNPTGLAVGADHTLAVGCDTDKDSLLLNLRTGITRPVAGAGQTDVVAYDPDTHRYSFASVTGHMIVAAESGQVTQVFPTIPGSHSVTAGHDWLLIPESGKGIAVFKYF